MENSLHIDGITKRFKNASSPALDNVSLQLAAGDIMALVGESGSGKTTLLRIIAGLEQPDSGHISVNGRTVCGGGSVGVSPEKRRIGLVFQDYALFPHLRVRDNLAYGLHRVTRSARRQRVAEIVRLTDLEGLESRYPHELSGGQQQRVALGRALAPDPQLLLLDEPFSSLDPVRRDALRDELRRILKRSQTSAFIVTHDTNDALAVADTLAVLKEGQLQQVGTPEQIYFHASNEYTARLFGKVNRIPRQLLGEDASANASPYALVRPTDLKLTHEAGNCRIVGTVIDCSFRGDFHEVTVACTARESDPPIHITINVTPETKVTPGDTVAVHRINRRSHQ